MNFVSKVFWPPRPLPCKIFLEKEINVFLIIRYASSTRNKAVLWEVGFKTKNFHFVLIVLSKSSAVQ